MTSMKTRASHERSPTSLPHALVVGITLLSSLGTCSAFARPSLAAITVSTAKSHTFPSDLVPTTAMSMTNERDCGWNILRNAAGVAALGLTLSVMPLPFLGSDGFGAGTIAPVHAIEQTNDDIYRQTLPKAPNKLSRSAIQEKMSMVPIFYLVNKEDGNMDTSIYMSYNDAANVATGATNIKATTLDQVM